MNTTYTLHFFKEGISFPVMLVVKNEWERTLISYLYASKIEYGMTTLKICRWCEKHQVNYRVIFPQNIRKLIMKSPKRLYCYLFLKWHKVESISL